MADDAQGQEGDTTLGAGSGAEEAATGPHALEPIEASASPAPVGFDEPTRDLPPEALGRLNQKAPPQRAITRRQGQRLRQRRAPLWAYALMTLLVVAIIGGLAYAIAGPTLLHNQGVNDINGCGNGSPCQVANAYLAAYTGGHYPAMYALTSSVSRARFDNPTLLHAASNLSVNSVDYSSAQDYMTRRTQGIINAAQVFGISATLGAVKRVNATRVSFPARIVMHSTSLGDVAVDITLPLRLEHNNWWVDWSPGLIFPQLDNPNDPNYMNLARLTTQSANRGTIYSGDGKALAIDETTYVVGVVPAQITSQSAVTQALVNNLDLTPAEITAAYQGKDAKAFWPERAITPMLYAQVSAALHVPGIQIQQSQGRVYPYGVATAPVTGYIGQVSPDDLKNDSAHYYQSGDIIGRAGVEAWGEQYLRPTKGGTLVIRARNGDGSDGSVVATIAQRTAQNGEDVYTTISLAAQQAAMANLAQQSGHSGGAVALDPTTGGVLAMASYPTYDPNDFSLGFTAKGQARFNALSSPYLNRATMAADPIGSVFKLVTLSAGLEHGISSSQIFTCNGTFQVPGENHLRHDDTPGGHGSLTAPQAIAPSCDVVFWNVAVILNQKDPTILSTEAKGFGFGAATGMIGLPSQEDNPGLVPDPAWLKANKNAQWTPTDAANLGIGQGFFEATPVQVAQMTATIANNGVRMRPMLVTKIVNAAGAVTMTFAPAKVGTAPISAANLQILQAAMLGPIYAPNGTATSLFRNYPVTVAGKTGTAESGQLKPHSWFTAYAPASKLSGPPATPQIAVGTLVEYSGEGVTYAGPVSQAIMTAYLQSVPAPQAPTPTAPAAASPGATPTGQ